MPQSFRLLLRLPLLLSVIPQFSGSCYAWKDETTSNNNEISSSAPILLPTDNIPTSNINMSTPSSSGIAAKLARKNILELQPYRCARDDYSEGVLLDANENAFGPTSLPTKNLDPYDNTHTLERYPDPYQTPLKELVAQYRGHGLTPSNLFVGVGSDEAIDLLMRIFCAPGQDNILITPPTYGMYKVCAKVNDVNIVSAPLTPDFDLDIPKVSSDVYVGLVCCLKSNSEPFRQHVLCFVSTQILSSSLDIGCGDGSDQTLVHLQSWQPYVQSDSTQRYRNHCLERQVQRNCGRRRSLYRF